MDENQRTRWFSKGALWTSGVTWGLGEIQILRPCPLATESDTPEVGPSNLC